MIAARRRLIAAGSAAMTAAATVAVVFAGGTVPAAAAPDPGPASGGTVRTVTLITGDRLAVTGSDDVIVERAEGRERVPVIMSKVDGHLHVVPADAVPLLRAGRLDARLFDVTTLLGYGYDTRSDVPLIVTSPAAAGGGAARSGVAARPAVPAGATAVRDLPGVRGVAVKSDHSGLATLWSDIRAAGTGPTAPKIWLDGVRRVQLDVSVPQIGAPDAWQAGFDGTGVRVAVLDSGIDGTHPDLAGQVVAQRNFVEGDDDLDHVGHGTHVASTIAGTGAGRYTGVAPGAKLIGAKVCTSFGCPESAMIAGMQWAVAEQHADVVNMSLAGGDTPEVDPVEQAVQELTARYGALFVISAGNAGQERAVGSPGSADAALTVGAVDDDEALAPFSSRGPRVGDSALKPDITAPGVGIVAARGKDAGMGQPGEQYVSSSGTSMSAPHVAGAAAILAQRRPGWDPATLKAGLMGSARPNPAVDVFAQGAGRVDVPAAIALTVTTAPASISFGRQAWPHTDDEVLTRTLTYANHGTAAVTLNLVLEPYRTVPANLFALDASSVTVPAGGSAEVTVSADTRVESPDGFFGAAVVATGAAGTVTRTPVAVEKEVESYDVTVVHTNRAGVPARYYSTALQGIDGPHGGFVSDEDGTVVTRVPKGRYFAFSNILDGDVGDPGARIDDSFLLQPVVTVTGPTTVTFDARTARPVTVTPPRPDARQYGGLILASVPVAYGGRFGFGVGVDTFDTLFTAAVGGDIRLDGLVTKVSGTWARANADGTVDDSPYQYNLAWTERGHAVTGFVRTVHRRDLATVTARYLSQIPGGAATKYAASRTRGIDFGGAVATRFHAPASRTEYYTTRDIHWVEQFEERSADDAHGVLTLVDRAEYAPGRSYGQTWNKGVFGPGLPGGYDPAVRAWVGRVGDTMHVNLPMFTDGAGRAGLSTGSGTMTLYRDGVKIGEAQTVDYAPFTVPPGRARYRLEIVDTRGEPFSLSTRVSGAWEFWSDSTPEDTMTALDLSAVRFTPALDESNTAPAGRRFTVPVTVQKQLGSTGGRNRSLSVEVSYDDGVTWRPVPVQTRHGAPYVTLDHPPGNGFVSLRAKATDTAGNTVEQTTVRAYRYGGPP